MSKYKLKEALSNPIWINHKINNVYYMDGKKDRWKLVYYPILESRRTKLIYNEPRALMQNIDNDGFWSKEVPLRYLENEI